MSVASLGFKIDSAQASSAAVDLEKLYAAAAKMETAAESLTTSAGALAGALKRVGDETKKIPPAAKPFQDQDDHVRAFRAEIERLTVKYQPLAQAAKTYEAAVEEINRAHRLGIINAQQMQRALDGERMAYERLKTSAMGAGHAIQAANQNGRAGSERAAGINAGYQFQDIAVTAAMGMNPLMIGLQQGTQLASVLATMERPVAGLAAAFASIISPVTLVTVGLVAGVSALVQYFTTAESGTEKTARLFEEQNEVIRRAADLWGDAAPALKAYVDELDRADKISQGREAGGILAGRELEGLSENLDSIKRQAIEAFRALQGDQNNAVIVRDLREAWGDLRERLDDGTASIADINRVQRELSEAVSKYGTPEVIAFSKAFDEVTAAIYRGVEAAQKARNEWIAALAGATTVQDILDRSTFNDNGAIRRPSDFIPRTPGIPGRRPSELGMDPDVARILNGDGRLTDIPIPGKKPNLFELEKEEQKVDDITKAYRRALEAKADFWLDLSFAERQAGRSAMDRQIASTLVRYGFDENLQSREADALRNQYQSQEINDIFKGFFTGAYQEAWNNGGKIGEAIVKSALNAAQKATEKAFDSLFDQLSAKLTNWIMGASGAASAPVAAAFNPTTTLGALLGAGGKAANDNSVSGVMGGSGASLAWNFWKSKGLADHQVAGILGNIKAESAFNPLAVGDGGNAFGLYQHNDRRFNLFNAIGGKGNLGDELAQHRFAYSELMGPESRAWNALKGATDVRGATAAFAGFERPSGFSWDNPGGAHNFAGRLKGAEEALSKFGGTASQATDSIGVLGDGLGKLGSTLQSIPQAMMANGGGGGILSGLTKYGLSLFSRSSQFANAWSLGGIGLYANGTNNAPGGLSVVGERGPELLNIPQGSGVMSNHKLMNALNNNGGGAQPVNIRVDVSGARGNAEIEDMVSKGVRQGIQHYDRSQAGRTAVKAVQSYQERYG